MNEAVVAIFIPIVIFIALAVVLSLYFMFRHRSRKEMQATIRAAIDKGQELSPEIIERLGSPPVPKDRDLRRGIISVALAIAVVAFGFAVDDEEALSALLGIAAFPLAIGLAFLLMHKLSPRD